MPVQSRYSRTILGFVLLLAISLIVAGCATAAASGTTLTATLSGAGGGDPNGSGTASITLNPTQRQVCYDITVSGIAPATAAHIHRGAAGQNGLVVVPLGAPTNGTARGCTGNVDPEVINAIAQNPSGFYVNVHNAPYPNGAIRGQLSG
jgi:hypothetical protein